MSFRLVRIMIYIYVMTYFFEIYSLVSTNSGLISAKSKNITEKCTHKVDGPETCNVVVQHKF